MSVLSHRRLTIGNPLGLHLRAAERIVRLAREFEADVHVLYEGKEANGKSILELTCLAAGYGTELHVEASGPDADAALAALAELIEARVEETVAGREDSSAA